MWPEALCCCSAVVPCEFYAIQRHWDRFVEMQAEIIFADESAVPASPPRRLAVEFEFTFASLREVLNFWQCF